MFDDFKWGFPIGTFEIDDIVFCVNYKTHLFNIKKECTYCNKNGTIEYKGSIFECPNCKGKTQNIIIKEKIIKDSYKIKSKVTMTNTKDSKEIYYTESNFLGVEILNREEEGFASFHKTKEEAQKVCDKWNEINETYKKLKLYSSEVI